MSRGSQQILAIGQPSLFRGSEKNSSGIVLNFAIFEFSCQVAVLFDLGPLRPLTRIAAFGASLFLLFLFRGTLALHPAKSALNWVLILVFLSVLYPATGTWLGGLAHASLYLAIICPIFWVPRLNLDHRVLRQVILIFWLFYTTSAMIGILQVYFPGTFQPALSPSVLKIGKGYVDSLMITNASGDRVFRPMGLTDNPGGAALAGFYTVLFGAGLLFTRSNTFLKAANVAGIAIGIVCLYLSQVRSVVVIAAISMVVFGGILLLRLRMIKLALLVSVLVLTILVGLIWSATLFDEKAGNRLSTLNLAEPAALYYASRGHFLEETINDLLPLYPFGAGLTRWGMMYYYFGRDGSTDTEPIYVEIQWTGWLLDGGVPLIVAYIAALFVTCAFAWRVIRKTPIAGGKDLWIWGSLLLAYNIAIIALTFSYTPFIGQAGMEFWLLNALLFSVATTAYPVLKNSARVK
jgi:hypothetical protein